MNRHMGPLGSLLVAAFAFVVSAAPALAGTVSSSVAANGTDGLEGCTTGIYATNRSESAIAGDPTRPGHLLGLSKFFFSSVSSGLMTDWSQTYRFHLGSYDISGGAGQNQLLPGYTCVPGTFQTNWDATTDPNVAFDSAGNAYGTVLGFNYNNLQNGIFVSKRPAGSTSWLAPVTLSLFTSNHGLGREFDKQWITADHNPSSPFRDNVYAAWTAFSVVSGEVYFSRSTDGGRTFSSPQVVSAGSGGFNTFVYLDVDSNGALYVEYTSFADLFSNSGQAAVRVSTDGGLTFSPARNGPVFQTIPFNVSLAPGNPTNWGWTLPNTTFRDGIVDFFAASHSNPGTLYIASEQWDKKDGTGTPTSGDGDYDIAVFRSTDAGLSWQSLGFANDAATVGDATDQFQPEVATDEAGHVAVAWYDRRKPCPVTQPAPDYFTRPGASNYCIQTALQWFDDASGARRGGNILLGPSWDPQEPANGPAPVVQPGQAPPTSYVSDLPHSVFNPCYSTFAGNFVPVCVTFIGDYFGLTVSNGSASILSISTFPSFQQGQPVQAWSQKRGTGITADSINPAANNFYQQAVLFSTSAP